MGQFYEMHGFHRHNEDPGQGGCARAWAGEVTRNLRD